MTAVDLYCWIRGGVIVTPPLLHATIFPTKTPPRTESNVDQDRVKEELDYRKEQLLYYGDEAKHKLDELPRPARYGLFAVLGLIFLLLLKSCMGGGGGDDSQDKPEVKNVVMPNLVLTNKLDAEQKLGDLGLNNYKEQLNKELSGNNPNDPDIILEQSPKAGANITTDTKVLLTYGSKGIYEKSKVNVKLPDLVGMTVQKAQALVNSKGYSNVTFPVRTNPNLKDDMLVIATMTPEAGTPGTLNTPIRLTVEPGLDVDDLKNKLKQFYIPYKDFANVERTTQRNLKITLAKKDNSIKSQNDADAAARLHKLSIEKVINQPLDDVTLVIPGVKFIGDSANVDSRATTSGITVPMAQEKCIDSVNGGYSDLKVNWGKDTLLKKVDGDSITLMARATATASDESTEQLVMSCTIAGDPSNLETKNFSLQ